MRKILAVALCIMLLTTSAYAAGLTSVEINQVYQNGEDLFVVFHASDENGEAMPGLTGEDVRLEVGGKILTTELLSQDTLGMGYVFAVDVSASLSVEQFAAVKEQMKSWATSLGAQDSMAIVTFGNSVTTVTDFTANTNTLDAIIDGLQPVDATTMLYSGLMRAFELATRQGANLPARRAVVLLSDGMNDTTVGAVGMQEMREKAVSSGVPLYIAGVVGDSNADSLAAMGEVARSTGGVIYTGSKDELGQCFERLGAYIESGFLIDAKVPASEVDSSQKGLILTVTFEGISATDSLDLRLRAMDQLSVPAQEETPPIEDETLPIEEETPPEEGQPEEPPADQLPAEQTEEPVEVSDIEQMPAEQSPEPAADAPQADDGGFLEKYGLYVYIGSGALLLILIVCCIAIPKKKKKMQEDKNGSEQEDSGQEELTEFDPVDGGGDRLVLTDAVMSQSYSCALKDRITIGRHDGNDIVVRDSRVSGSHCEIIRDNGRLYVRDAGSRNGTRVVVNGVRYQVDSISGQEVQVGDEIEVGHTRLQITEA